MRIGVGLPFKDQQGQPLDAAGLGRRAIVATCPVDLTAPGTRPPATSQAPADYLGAAS
ncbi:MAG TPA: hypothetical protein VF223_06900 [Trebonia sp.]